ncbi:MAG: hypothetical protein NT039_01630, partial [Candidatus Berkelbacteria bacterium]|nr:hypothetical protein [Candidatus Berkelbacteria bacterium]
RRKLAFLHLGGQTPLRYDQDHSFLGGNSCMKSSFYVMLAVVEHQPDCILEFDCHPFRTEAGTDSRDEFICANLIAAGMLKRKAQEFLAIPRVQELRALSSSTGFGFTGNLTDKSGSCWLQLKADDPNEGQDYDPRAQELDMLVNMHLMGKLVA